MIILNFIDQESLCATQSSSSVPIFSYQPISMREMYHLMSSDCEYWPTVSKLEHTGHLPIAHSPTMKLDRLMELIPLDKRLAVFKPWSPKVGPSVLF